MPPDVTEHCFQQVVAAVEHAGREASAEYSQCIEELEKTYSTVLNTSEKSKCGPMILR